MGKVAENNKRIARNTMYLYIRMAIVMVVSLFTVRVVLNALGAEDYGIRNVVGGAVTMFAFLTSTMNSASLRFFSYYLGNKDYNKLSEYFSISFWCFAGMAAIIVFLAETVGLWFVKTKLVIPVDRMDAAMWVYQCSVITFVFRTLTIPYNAIIIAREKMDIYAIGGLLEVFLKLGVAYLLYISPVDKLKAYAVLLCIMMCSIDIFYIFYALRRFSESRIKMIWDKSIFKEVVSYSGWSLFGAISGVIRSQGINILLNMFFSPIVNAARAIAYQVNNAINHFVLNFHKAVQPQITKYYAAGEKKDFFMLIFRSSRLYFYLILFLSLPALIETPFILTLWLKNVPDNTVLFTRLVIIISIIDSMSYSLQTSISSTGKIRCFQIVTGSLLILNLPVAWFFLKMGYPPESTMYVAMGISVIAQITRVYFSHVLCGLPVAGYIKSALLPIILVSMLSFPIPMIMEYLMEEGGYRFIMVTLTAMVVTSIVIACIGITDNERRMIVSVVRKKLGKGGKK